jgi:hypothetical protein
VGSLRQRKQSLRINRFAERSHDDIVLSGCLNLFAAVLWRNASVPASGVDADEYAVNDAVTASVCRCLQNLGLTGAYHVLEITGVPLCSSLCAEAGAGLICEARIIPPLMDAAGTPARPAAVIALTALCNIASHGKKHRLSLGYLTRLLECSAVHVRSQVVSSLDRLTSRLEHSTFSSDQYSDKLLQLMRSLENDGKALTCV